MSTHKICKESERTPTNARQAQYEGRYDMMSHIKSQLVRPNKYHCVSITAGCKLSLVIVAHRRLGRKPATLEIAYDMKIDFLLWNLYFPLIQKSVIGTASLQIT